MPLLTAPRLDGLPLTPSTFFSAPVTGRRIITGFSHLQRIHKNATTEVWFPENLFTPDKDRIEWAAVRQFDILQEADNFYIYDMNVSDLKYSFENILKMRAGGYRITIITLGQYTERHDLDDLQLLDSKLQEEITRMIHFLYLNELSELSTQQNNADLDANAWCVANNLEHVALSLGTQRLFKPDRETMAERVFFEILDKLSRTNILHDTGIGLQLPESTKDHIQVYIAKGENQLWRFQQAITTVFENLDKSRATMTHMRGYGDHMIQGFKERQGQSLALLNAA